MKQQIVAPCGCISQIDFDASTEHPTVAIVLDRNISICASHDVISNKAQLEQLKAEVKRLQNIFFSYRLTKSALATHTAACDICEAGDYCEVGDRLIQAYINARLNLEEGGVE